MITLSDFIRIDYTPDLTLAGIAYACRSLAYTYDRMGGSAAHRMRRIVIGKAVELAFRRRLSAQGIPHDNLGTTPFTDPDHYDLSLGGRRCDIKSYHIHYKDRIRKLKRDPACLLDAAALVPVDQAMNSRFENHDLYIFAFVTGLTAPLPDDYSRAVAAGQLIHLIHPLPQAWARPKTWRSLGRLALKADIPQAMQVELGGQGRDHQFQTEQITLEPLTRTPVSQDFYSIAYLHVSQPPEGRVGISSPVFNETYLIDPEAWENIWIYGMEIILTGFMARGEYLQQAYRLPAGSRVFQYPRTRTPNLSLPVRELYPLEYLFQQVRQWDQMRR